MVLVVVALVRVMHVGMVLMVVALMLVVLVAGLIAVVLMIVTLVLIMIVGVMFVFVTLVLVVPHNYLLMASESQAAYEYILQFWHIANYFGKSEDRVNSTNFAVICRIIGVRTDQTLEVNSLIAMVASLLD